jgi:hypothetical protein
MGCFRGGTRIRLLAIIIVAILVPATLLLALLIFASSIEATIIAVAVFDAAPVWWGSAPSHVISVVPWRLRAHHMS